MVADERCTFQGGARRRAGEVASEVLLRPIPDPVASDNPALPRYLFIGDSISGNYDRGLREALAGKLNAHHPPTNCGPSRKGRERTNIWLGDYGKKGRHWDIISFNFGHWDSEHQAGLPGELRGGHQAVESNGCEAHLGHDLSRS